MPIVRIASKSPCIGRSDAVQSYWKVAGVSWAFMSAFSLPRWQNNGNGGFVHKV